ncbi:major facilitator superfamily domain-containing protein rtet [Brevipalpus obovatus]|uniref:major facilitator superfamily domain-containing protein rtet n=1 Tax=Brevipalpus obovatus TaxID=246614 RepID=UPI003D9EE05B
MIGMNHSCYIVFTSLILDLLGFTIILPLIPSLLDYYQSNDQSGWYSWLDNRVDTIRHYLHVPSEHNKVLFAGLIGSWFSFLQFACSPFIGALSDVFGRRSTLIGCLLGTIISYILWMCSGNSFFLFFASRTIGGLSKGNISLCTAIMTDLSSIADRTKGMALIGISFSIGFIFGPMIGAYFSYLSKNSSIISISILPQNAFIFPAAFATILAILNLVFVISSLEESLPKAQRLSSLGYGISRALNFVNPLSLFRFNPVQRISDEERKDLGEIGTIYFLFLFLYSGLEYTLTFLAHQRFEYTRMQQAKMFLFNGLLMTILQGGYVRRLAPGKELQTVINGIILIIPSFIFIGLATTQLHFYLSLSLYAFSSATVVPCLTTLASSKGPPDQKGTILGTFRSLGSLARAFGPIVSAFGYWTFGGKCSYCVGGILLTLPLLRSLALKRRAKVKKSA